jgi:hypothetical protein
MIKPHKAFLRSMILLLVTVDIVPIMPILLTLMKEEIRSSETSEFFK